MKSKIKEFLKEEIVVIVAVAVILPILVFTLLQINKGKYTAELHEKLTHQYNGSWNGTTNTYDKVTCSGELKKVYKQDDGNSKQHKYYFYCEVCDYNKNGYNSSFEDHHYNGDNKCDDCGYVCGQHYGSYTHNGTTTYCTCKEHATGVAGNNDLVPLCSFNENGICKYCGSKCTHDRYYLRDSTWVANGGTLIEGKDVYCGYCHMNMPTVDNIKVFVNENDSYYGTGDYHHEILYGKGDTIRVTVIFEEEVSGTVPTLKLWFGGNAAKGTVTKGKISDKNKKIINYTYIVKKDDNGKMELNLEGGELTGISNKPVGLPIKDVLNDEDLLLTDVSVDSINPTLTKIEVSSTDNKKDCKAGTVITIKTTFSEDLKESQPAPELKLFFGDLATDQIERTVSSGIVRGNTVTYTYKIANGDNGKMRVEYAGYSKDDTVLTQLTDLAGNNFYIPTDDLNIDNTSDANDLYITKEIIADTKAPILTITSDNKKNPTNKEKVTYTFEFDESVYEFDKGDITIEKYNSIGDLKTEEDGKKYTLEVTNNGSCEQIVSVSKNAFKDVAGNFNTEEAKITITIDRTAPTLVITVEDPNAILEDKKVIENDEETNAKYFNIQFKFNELVDGFEQDDITVELITEELGENPITLGDLVEGVEDGSYNLKLSCGVIGTLKVSVENGTCSDTADNLNLGKEISIKIVNEEIKFNTLETIEKDGINYVKVNIGTKKDDIEDDTDINARFGKSIVFVNTDGSNILKTGTELKFDETGEPKYIVVVKGDVNSDGKVDIQDLREMNKVRLNGTETSMNPEKLIAANLLGNDEKIEINDMREVNKIRLNQ